VKDEGGGIVDQASKPSNEQMLARHAHALMVVDPTRVRECTVQGCQKT